MTATRKHKMIHFLSQYSFLANWNMDNKKKRTRYIIANASVIGVYVENESGDR